MARFEEALALAQRLGAGAREAAVLTARVTLEQERGHFEEARDLHERAVALYRDLGMVYPEASTLYYLAGAHLEAGRRADADAIFGAALRLVQTIGVPRYEALILGALSASRARAGAVLEARAMLDEADRAALACRSERSLLATLEIHRMQLGSIDEGALAVARALAARHRCDDPRFALRLLTAPRADSSEQPLVVHRDGVQVQVPGLGAPIVLGRRTALARALLALARARVERPGEVVRVDEILSAAWPGEKVRYEAGKNRVYVAIAELRRMGLREWLVSESGGYRISTSRPVIVE